MSDFIIYAWFPIAIVIAAVCVILAGFITTMLIVDGTVMEDDRNILRIIFVIMVLGLVWPVAIPAFCIFAIVKGIHIAFFNG